MAPPMQSYAAPAAPRQPQQVVQVATHPEMPKAAVSGIPQRRLIKV